MTIFYENIIESVQTFYLYQKVTQIYEYLIKEQYGRN